MCSAYIKYLILMIAHGLNGSTPTREDVESFLVASSEEKEPYKQRVAKWCESQKIGGVVSAALASSRVKYGAELLSDEIMAPWDEVCGQTFLRNTYFQGEREAIFKWMDSRGIWYVPLKGIVLNELYPDVSMRSAVDNDILYDAKYMKDLRDFMISRGYTVEHYATGHDDGYTKEPCLNFEMHRFISAGRVPGATEYYANLGPSDRRIENGRLRKEDFYIYHIVHSCNHYRVAGFGLRPLTDLYVMLRAWPELDMEYIGTELQRLGIRHFEEKLRSYSERLFAKTELISFEDFTTDEWDVLAMIFGTASLGSERNRVRMGIQAQRNWTGELESLNEEYTTAEKIRYLAGRAFPPAGTIQHDYPFTKNHPVLLPLGYLKRIIHARKKAMREIRGVRSN